MRLDEITIAHVGRTVKILSKDEVELVPLNERDELLKTYQGLVQVKSVLDKPDIHRGFDIKRHIRTMISRLERMLR